MTSAPPPSRYRIVEQDRRLVVIDLWASSAPDQTAKASPIATPKRARNMMQTTGFDGRGTIATSRWFDANGPRSIAVDPVTMRQLKIIAGMAGGAAVLYAIAAINWPILILPLAFLLGSNKARTAWRQSITAYLDRIADG